MSGRSILSRLRRTSLGRTPLYFIAMILGSVASVALSVEIDQLLAMGASSIPSWRRADDHGTSFLVSLRSHGKKWWRGGVPVKLLTLDEYKAKILAGALSHAQTHVQISYVSPFEPGVFPTRHVEAEALAEPSLFLGVVEADCPLFCLSSLTTLAALPASTRSSHR